MKPLFLFALIVVAGCSAEVASEASELDEAEPRRCGAVVDEADVCAGALRLDCTVAWSTDKFGYEDCYAPADGVTCCGPVCPDVDAAGFPCQPYPDDVLEDGTTVWACPGCS